MKHKLFAGLALIAFSLGAGNLNVADYPYQKTVEIPASGKRPAVFAIPVDEEIYRHAYPFLTDLRIVDTAGKTVSYAVHTRPKSWQSTAACTPLAGKITDFKLDKKSNVATLDYELGKTDLPLTKLELVCGKADFDKTVTLEFDDGTKVENLKLFRNQDVDVQNGIFPFAPHHAHRVRIYIANFVETHSGANTLEHQGVQDSFTESRLISEGLRIEKITFFGEQKVITPEPSVQNCQLPELSRAEKDSKTVIRVDAMRRKINALRIQSATPEYRRALTVESYRVGKSKMSLGRVTQEIDGKHEIRLAFDNAPDEIAVTIENGDDPELSELKLEWSIPEEVLVIEGATAPTGTLRILYGGNAVQPPKYGLGRYIEQFYGKEWKALPAAPESANPEFQPTAPKSDGSKFGGHTLSWVIGIAALLLAVFAWKNFQKITPEKE